MDNITGQKCKLSRPHHDLLSLLAAVTLVCRNDDFVGLSEG